jgi:hypothetical protein
VWNSGENLEESLVLDTTMLPPAISRKLNEFGSDHPYRCAIPEDASEQPIRIPLEDTGK